MAHNEITVTPEGFETLRRLCEGLKRLDAYGIGYIEGLARGMVLSHNDE